MEDEERMKRGSPPLTEGKRLMDAAAKRLLSRPEFLSVILKHTIPELRDRDTDWIGRNSITEDGVTISDRDVDDVSRMVRGMNTESSSPDEGRVTFDLLFPVLLPGGNERVRVIVNIEVQRDDTGPTAILKRATYYASRLISDQKGTVFMNSEYSKIEKVCSIWIMVAPPEKRKNSVTFFEIRPRTVVGEAEYHRKDYDNLAIVMVCLGQWDEAESDLLRMLDIMFDESLRDREKCRLWEKECNVVLGGGPRKETEDMCNYSDYIADKYQGIGIGIGEDRGIMKERDCYSALIRKLAELNRIDDIVKAANDNEHLLSLYREFGIRVAR